ncbi:TPA: hypothetical protein ACGFEM_002039 [Clostridioides difficile]|nr:hypothetical protein [Clostridioides difficile]AXU54399.1 hypothetical protein CDIF29637_02673 [Clostridioides difficile]EIS9354149.1 hypothetical protein [Clostridioides difficile]EIS9362634.1 hypothetical protein [Clostridioides difficile]EIS9478677.1 hypothetical protein [Clostridioides difficile]EQH02526.1 hypothetical protein QKQ_2850 [Clostridioides difficile DA00196]
MENEKDKLILSLIELKIKDEEDYELFAKMIKEIYEKNIRDEGIYIY